jgi:ABC-2 type transport system ATP-binding protein
MSHVVTFDRARRQSPIALALSVLISLSVTFRNQMVRAVSGVRSAAARGSSAAAPEAAALATTKREPERLHEGDPVLALDSVVKRYGALVAVNAVSIEVNRGEIFGILGPNGAGKTTTLEMIEGLRAPDDGCITILGMPAQRQRRRIQQLIGVQLQSQTLWQELTVEETLRAFRTLFKNRVSVETLLDRFALREKRRSLVGGLSGGQKQRLALACAVVNDPELILLDEPTTGLDPQARLVFWDLILDMKADGKTIVLTTHYMEEAAQLCDRVAVMDKARIIAMGTPRELVRELEFDNTIECLFDGDIDQESLLALPEVTGLREQADGSHFIFTKDVARSMAALIGLAEHKGATIANLQVRSATLEDVFISFTGRRLRD